MKTIPFAEIDAYILLYGVAGPTNISLADYKKAGDEIIRLAERVKQARIEAADSPEFKRSNWVLEREAAIAQLRDLCDEFGDNDWSEELHLADVVEKHLGKYLYSNHTT